MGGGTKRMLYNGNGRTTKIRKECRHAFNLKRTVENGKAGK